MHCSKRCLGVQGPGTLYVLWTGHQAFLLCQLRCHCICCSHTDACTCCVGGQAIDVLVRGDTPVTLTEYIVIFGAINLVIAQCPNVHSIRFVNQCSTFCTICFSIIAVALSLYSGAHSCHLFMDNIIIIITFPPFQSIRICASQQRLFGRFLTWSISISSPYAPLFTKPCQRFLVSLQYGGYCFQCLRCSLYCGDCPCPLLHPQ